jgi:thiol-disulfide isomerase/thioredoxin
LILKIARWRMQFVNHYSALILWLLLLAGGLSVALRRGKKALRWAIFCGILLVPAAIWLAIRPVAALGVPVEKQPWLLEIQSPFCLACLAQKSEVDRVEKEFQGRLVVRRVDIQSAEGRKLAEKHDVQRTPSFVFFDQVGEEQWQSIGKLDVPRLRSSLKNAVAH